MSNMRVNIYKYVRNTNNAAKNVSSCILTAWKHLLIALYHSVFREDNNADEDACRWYSFKRTYTFLHVYKHLCVCISIVLTQLSFSRTSVPHNGRVEHTQREYVGKRCVLSGDIKCHNRTHFKGEVNKENVEIKQGMI